MRFRTIFAWSMLFITATVVGAEGMVQVPSTYGVAETADRMERVLTQKGMTVFKRIDHSAAASSAGIDMRPMELLIFGNPKVGSLLMQCQQSIAIDLPQKALVWEDANSKVWISYNDPAYLADRHRLDGCEEVISKIAKALAGISAAAVADAE